MTIIAVNLVALGVLLLAFAGMFFSTLGQPVNFPGMLFETAGSHVIVSVLGAVMVVGGTALLIMNSRRAA